MTAAEKPKRTAGPRLQHVAARRAMHPINGTEMDAYDEVVVFGQKVDALEHIYQADGQWIYAALGHGQPLTDALNQAGATS